MQTILELDGLVFEIGEPLYRAHAAAAGELGWSKLDPGTFRRLLRTKGAAADFLRGAPHKKAEAYAERFAELARSGEILGSAPVREGISHALRRFRREGAVIGVTAGAALESWRASLETARLGAGFSELLPLAADPRRRSVELKALAGGDRRTLVVAATEVLCRSADAAGCVCVGIPLADATGPRLQRAGADLVVGGLDELAEMAGRGAPELVRAGLPPVAGG